MYLTQRGGLIVDTPGLREVQLWADEETGMDPLEEAFPEIVELESECRFRDCRHEHEPGCAVKAAVEEGSIAADRYGSYIKLRAEAETTVEMRKRRREEWGKQISKFAREIKKARNA
jgi:ribosome biogenesis GTPase